MPSPFPGMDPYLESTDYCRGFHAVLIPSISAQLNSTLPGGFAAYVEERIYVLAPDDFFIPDVIVNRLPIQGANQPGGSAVLDRTADSAEIVTYYPNHERELFIEIRQTGNRQGPVVAAIELLSPANKQLGGRGRQEYVTKQSELLESDTNLLEIDLLRAGAHTVAAPRTTVSSRGAWDYLACLHRVGRRNTFEIWRNSLRRRLPIVKIPLTADQPDATLDLQEALDITYDSGPYPRVLDYRGHRSRRYRRQTRLGRTDC